MKKSIVSVVLLISLVFQTTYPLLEGVKQRAVSVKEAMSKARSVLKENWQCFISGKGPNCTKEQRSALGIISDFVSGKWNTAKAKLEKCLDHEVCMTQLGLSTVAVMSILSVLLGGGGAWAIISWEDRQKLEKLAPQKNE